MSRLLSAKELRATLPAVVERVRRGERFTLVYRSRPVLELVPLEAAPPSTPLEDDPMFRMSALGRSTDGLTSADHDAVLYGESPPRRRR